MFTRCTPCNPSNGTPWNNPGPGNLIVVPPGSQVVAVPQSSGCEEDQDATGTVGGGSPANPIVAGFAYPIVASVFTAPPLNATGQLYSTGAAQWAFPGLSIWLPSFNGYITITGVSGDLVTFKNLTLAQGTNVNAGTPLIPAAPLSAAQTPAEVTLLDGLLGLVGGVQAVVPGAQGQILRRGASQWRLVNAPLLQTITSQPIALTIKRDVVNSASTSTATNGKWIAPVSSAINIAAPTGTITFPQWPTLDPDTPITAVVQVKWKMAALTLDAVRLTVTINGLQWQVVTNCIAVTDSAALANTAAFTAAVNNKGNEGSDFMLIPLPTTNTPVNVSMDARKAGNTTAPLDANTHYVVDFHVTGYLY